MWAFIIRMVTLMDIAIIVYIVIAAFLCVNVVWCHAWSKGSWIVITIMLIWPVLIIYAIGKAIYEECIKV